MKFFLRPMMTFRRINRNIWILPNQNPPIFGMRGLFQSDQNIEKKDHTHELLTSYKKVHKTESPVKIEEDDYDLLACPPENLIHPKRDATKKNI